MRRLQALLLAVLVPVPLSAQSMVGTVVDAGGGNPVVGAMVRLMRDSLWTGALFLTAGDGAYRLDAPGPGSYSLRVERIGFTQATVGPFALNPDEVLRRDVVVTAEAVRLEGLEVSGRRRRCDLHDGGGGATQLLWTEARKALAAASWTERQGTLRFQVNVHERTLDPRTTAVLDETQAIRTIHGGNSVRSLPPDELASGGYVREEDGRRYFYGPDAETLLSDVFLSTHCFAVERAPKDEPALVGLRFEPVGGRRVPDIAGVLWIDRASNRLERVDFHYTESRLGSAERFARGQVRFAALPDGHWIVRDWSIRAPLVTLLRSVSGREATLGRSTVSAVAESGVTVVAVAGPALTWRADEPGLSAAETSADSLALAALRCPVGSGAVVVGRVVERLGTVAAGAVVTVDPAPDPDGEATTGVTDADGWFALCGLPEDTALRLVVRRGLEVSEPVEVRTAVGPVRVDLTLGAGRNESGRAPGRGDAAATRRRR